MVLTIARISLSSTLDNLKVVVSAPWSTQFWENHVKKVPWMYLHLFVTGTIVRLFGPALPRLIKFPSRFALVDLHLRCDGIRVIWPHFVQLSLRARWPISPCLIYLHTAREFPRDVEKDKGRTRRIMSVQPPGWWRSLFTESTSGDF